MSGNVLTTTASIQRSLCLAAILVCAAAPARAVDGCKVLLCMAGNWRNIGACRSEVEQALRDVARGRGFPECAMGGSSQAGNTFMSPDLCPVQYRSEIQLESGVMYVCPFSGAIGVVVAGQPWSRTWWAPGGDSVTEWLPAARAQFAGVPNAMDNRFDQDYAAWLASQPAMAAPMNEPSGEGR